jgi:hypothetical protein
MPRVAFRLPISCLRMSCVVHKPLPFFLLPPLSYLSKRATFSSLVCRGAMLIWWCLPAGSVVGDGRTYFSVRKAASFILSDLSFLHRRGSIVVSVPCIAHCYWPCCTCMSPARKPWYTPLFILCGACVCLMFLYLNVSSIHEVCFSMTFSFSCYVGCFQVALDARVINRDLWLTWVPYIVLHTYTNLSALADEWFGASHICSCGRWPPLFEAIFHFYADVILPLLLQYALLAVASHDAL